MGTVARFGALGVMKTREKVWLLVNEASGSHTHERIEQLLSGLDRAGMKPARIIDCASESLPDKAELSQASVGVFVVHGGDGTLNAVLARAEHWDGTVLALPGGTANLLCRALYDEPDLDRILERLSAGNLCRVRRSCIRNSGRMAMAEVLIGPGATWSDVREEIRDGTSPMWCPARSMRRTKA